MTETKSPGTVGVLVLHVGAQSLNSALGTKMLLLFISEDSRFCSVLRDKLILFDKMAFNQTSQPSFALEYRL